MAVYIYWVFPLKCVYPGEKDGGSHFLHAVVCLLIVWVYPILAVSAKFLTTVSDKIFITHPIKGR